LAAEPLLPVELVRPADGRPVELAAGAPALHLVFFATWCPECVAELERLAELEARWKSRGYRQVLIAVPTRQTAERLEVFRTEQLPPGELLFDAGGRATARFGAEHLPLHVVLDAQGAEIVRAERLSPQIDAALEQALARPGRRRSP
jgi:thiol-disulfide isomerase/thioredoxin